MKRLRHGKDALDWFKDCPAPTKPEYDELLGAEELVWRAMRRISERDVAILCYRFIDGHTLQQIGNAFNISRERVNQIVYNTCRKLRERVMHEIAAERARVTT